MPSEGLQRWLGGAVGCPAPARSRRAPGGARRGRLSSRRLAAALALFVGCAGGVAAQPVGRYAAVVVGDAEFAGARAPGRGKVFILDTRDGHFWTWSEDEVLGAPGSPRALGPKLQYHGQLRPGTRPGEVIEGLGGPAPVQPMR